LPKRQVFNDFIVFLDKNYTFINFYGIIYVMKQANKANKQGVTKMRNEQYQQVALRVAEQYVSTDVVTDMISSLSFHGLRQLDAAIDQYGTMLALGMFLMAYIHEVIGE
jgi:hypothetical protein